MMLRDEAVCRNETGRIHDDVEPSNENERNVLTENAIKLNLESLVTGNRIGHSLERASQADAVIVDVSSLKRLNVGLLEALVLIKKAMLRGGRPGIVRLIVRSPMIHETLAVTGLGKLFEVYATAEMADAAQGRGRGPVLPRVAA